MQDVHSIKSAPNGAFIKLAKLLLELNYGFPYFPSDYVRRYIERPETEVRELQAYRSTTIKRPVIRMLLIVSSLWLACSILLPAMQLFKLNYNEPAANLRPIKLTGSGKSLSSFDCLLTDCPGKLKEEEDNNQTGSLAHKLLLELPLFSLCHPKLAYHHEITQLYGPLGFLFAAALGVTLIVCGLAFPLFQATFKSSCLTLMFLVAPTVTRRVVYDRALELYDELRQSGADFERNARLQVLLTNYAITYDQLAQVARSRGGSFGLTPCANRKFGYSSEDGEQCTLAAFPMIEEENVVAVGRPTSNCGRAQERHEFAADCVSSMRSRWWHSKATRVAQLLFTCIACNTPCVTLTVYYAIFHLQQPSIQLEVKALAQMVSLNNCTIWLMDSYDGTTGIVHSDYRTLELDTYEVPSHPIGYLVFIAQLSWPLICGNSLVFIYLLVTAELIAWLYEVKLQLRLLNEYLQQYMDRSQIVQQHSYTRQHSSRSLLEQFRRLFQELTNLQPYLYVQHRKFGRQLTATREWRTTSSHLSTALAIEAHVTQSLRDNELSLLTLIELMEKLQVSLRLFVEQVHYQGPIMSICLSHLNFHIYLNTTLIIVYLRKIDQNQSTSVGCMIISWIIVISLLWFVSSFHAKAKELQPLIWSLLAKLTLCSHQLRNARLRHVQSLWLKQVVALNLDGGLALRAYNLSITYVRIIQLFIGTATLITLALR